MRKTTTKKLLIFGHRGAPAHERENTIKSFKKAIEQGADGIELDVQKSKDNYILIHHDEFLIDNKSAINKNNFSKIQKIQKKAPLNTLNELLPLLKDIKILNIEIKSTSFFNNKIERDIIDFIIENQIENKTIVSSFNPIVLLNIKKINKNIKTGYLYTKTDIHWILKTYLWANIVKPDTLHVDLECLDNKIIKWCKQKNIPIYIFTINTKEDYLYIKKTGVNGFFTDDPQKIKSYI